jgi:hypothetical protein
MKFRMLGLAAAACLVVMAFVGASSASAESTALCTVHEEPCAAANMIVTLQAVAKDPKLLFKFMGAATVVLCERSQLTLILGALGAPQVATPTELKWENCETGGTPCEVTTVSMGTFDILKTALNLGLMKSLGNEVNVNCVEAGITCTFGGEPQFGVAGAGHMAGAGHGMFTANKLSMERTAGPFCEATAALDALYEPATNFFVVS